MSAKFCKGVIFLSLKSKLDARVRRYRAKYFPKRGEIISHTSKRVAKHEWNFLRVWFFVTQRGNNQVVVYIGMGTSPKTGEHYLVHKTCWLGRQYWHCIALKFPKETIREIVKLAEEDGLRVVTCTEEDRAKGESPNVEWKCKIIYDVPVE